MCYNKPVIIYQNQNNGTITSQKRQKPLIKITIHNNPHTATNTQQPTHDTQQTTHNNPTQHTTHYNHTQQTTHHTPHTENHNLTQQPIHNKPHHKPHTTNHRPQTTHNINQMLFHIQLHVRAVMLTCRKNMANVRQCTGTQTLPNDELLALGSVFIFIKKNSPTHLIQMCLDPYPGANVYQR